MSTTQQDVDGSDSAVFAADFGRTDCSGASGIIDSYAKEIQLLRSELKAKEKEISELKAR